MLENPEFQKFQQQKQTENVQLVKSHSSESTTSQLTKGINRSQGVCVFFLKIYFFNQIVLILVAVFVLFNENSLSCFFKKLSFVLDRYEVLL